MSEFLFWLFRIRVSIYGSMQFRQFGWYGFADDDLDRDAFEGNYSVRDYFIEAWCRE